MNTIVPDLIAIPGDVTVEAEDQSVIRAILLAASIAAGGAGAVSVNVSVSATYAQNEIGGESVVLPARMTMPVRRAPLMAEPGRY